MNKSTAIRIFTLLLGVIAAFGSRSTFSQENQKPLRPIFDERFDDWPQQVKIKGRILICREVTDFASMTRLLKRLVNQQKTFSFAPESDLLGQRLRDYSSKENFTSSDTSDTTVKSDTTIDQLKTALQKGDVVYLSKNSFATAELVDLRNVFSSFLQNGKTLIADASFANLLGSVARASESNNGKTADHCLDLLPDCCIDPAFDGTPDSKKLFATFLEQHPRIVGIGIEPETMLMLSGRMLVSQGKGKTTLVVPASENQKPSFQTISATRSRDSTARADLTQWRRVAIDRSLEPFPAAKPKTPFVENGTLYIVGGGGTPKGLMSEMIEKAGGLENARLVYIPCSEADEVGERQRTVQMWKRMGVKHATFLHTKDRDKANSDDEFLKPLQDATMLWFGGGRQWNFADSWYGTKAHRMMKKVLHRGGVIGGSSAGASIQGRFLARATPIGNMNILAPGYERGGLGFLTGVAIDQHFSQRRRQKDMSGLVDKYPQLLGIGIDESTAIIVEKSQATVAGQGRVYFYDCNRPVNKGEPDFTALAAGAKFDLAKRKVIPAK